MKIGGLPIEVSVCDSRITVEALYPVNHTL